MTLASVTFAATSHALSLPPPLLPAGYRVELNGIFGPKFIPPSDTYSPPSLRDPNSELSNEGINANIEIEPAVFYNFAYNVQDYQSGNDFGHMESRDGNRATGRYHVLLLDGRRQVS